MTGRPGDRLTSSVAASAAALVAAVVTAAGSAARCILCGHWTAREDLAHGFCPGCYAIAPRPPEPGP